MAGRGREVADAYIEVHGDLSKFRNDLNKGKPIVKKTGDEYGKMFNDAFEKRGKAEMADKVKSIFDSAYSRNAFDWDKVFGKFDSKNLDNAQTKLNDFLKDLERRGEITSKQYEELVAASNKARQTLKRENAALEEHNRIVTQGAIDKRKYAIQRAIQHERVKTQYKEAKELAKELIEIERDQADQELKAHNRLIAEGKKLRQQAANEHALQTQRSKRAWKELGEEIKRQSMSFEFMSEKFKEQKFEQNWAKLVKFVNDSELGPSAKSIEAFDKWHAEMKSALKEAQTLGRVTSEEFDRISKKIDKSRSSVTKVTKESNVLTRAFHRLSGVASKAGKAMKGAWKGMDDDVKVVLAVIAAAAGPLSAGLSGIAASITAIASSAVFAAASVVPLVSAFSGLGIAIALSVSSMESMKAQFPGIEQGISKISASWKKQAEAFGAQWGASLDRLLNNFGTKLGSVDFGTPLGKAFSTITDAFNGVVNGAGFSAFLRALTNDIPAAVAGFGKGFAGVMDAVMNLMAGAAPVAKLLGEDFARWGRELGKAMEKARESGAMNAVFEKARESLKAILDLFGSVGSAMGTLFSAGVDSGNRLITSLTGVINKWNEWMQSSDGQNWLKQWFEDGERIIKSFGPLLVGVAGFFDNLVTPHAINQFTSLMEKLGEFLPMLGNMLAVVSNLGIFNILVDALTAFGSAVQPLIPSLSILTTMIGNGLSAAIKNLTPLFSAIGQALAPIVAKFVEVASAVIPVLVAAFGRISTALTPVIQVIGQVVAVIVDVLAPILGAFLIGIINAAVGFIEGIATAFMGVVNIVKGLFTGDWTMVWEGIKMVVSGVIEAIWNFIQLTLVGKVFGAIKGFLLGAKTLFTSTWTSISTSFNAILTTIWNFVKSIFTGIGSSIRTILTGIKSFWTTIWNGIKTVASTVWNGIKSVISTVFNAIKSFITSTINGIKSTWSSVWNAIKNTAKSIWNGIKSLVSNAFNNIRSNISNTISNIKALWNAGWNVIRSVVTGVWNGIKGVVRGAINAVRSTINSVMNSIRNVISSIWNGIRSVFSNALNAVKSIVRNGFNAMQNAVRNGISNAVGFIRGLPGKIRSALGSVGSLLSGAGRAIMDGLLGGLKRAWNGVKNFVGGVADWIRNNKGPISYDRRLLIPAGEAIMKGLGEGLEGMIPNLKGTLNNITDGIVDGFTSKDDQIKKAAEGMSNIVVGALGASKMVIAGKDAASGFAQGLRANARVVNGALGNLGSLSAPDSSLVVKRPIVGRTTEADAQVPAGNSTVFEDGAIRVETPASDGKIVAKQLLDEIARKGA